MIKSLRIEFSMSENPKIHKNFLVWTILGDDVAKFEIYIFWLPVWKFFHFRSDQMAVTSGHGRFWLPFFHSELGLSRPSFPPNMSVFEPHHQKLEKLVYFSTRIWRWLMMTSSFLKNSNRRKAQKLTVAKRIIKFH